MTNQVTASYDHPTLGKLTAPTFTSYATSMASQGCAAVEALERAFPGVTFDVNKVSFRVI